MEAKSLLTRSLAIIEREIARIEAAPVLSDDDLARLTALMRVLNVTALRDLGEKLDIGSMSEEELTKLEAELNGGGAAA